MRSSTRLLLWVLVAVGALSALWVAGRRWQVEKSNQQVEIVLDWDEARSVADETGTPLAEVLSQFYAVGARGLAIGEETIGEMQTLKRLDLLPPEPIPAPSARSTTPSAPATPVEMTTRLRVSDTILRARILNSLRHKWDVTLSPAGDVLTLPAAWPDVAGLSIGFPPDVVTFARAHHLEPVLRVSNYTGADPDAVSWTADLLEAAHGRLIIFGGDQVLGYPDGVKETAKAFGARDLIFGQVEFGKQKGEDALAKALKGNIVRVHSINPAEMARLSQPDAVDRFLRAAEERNIRAMYVRLLPGAPQPPVEANVRYVNDIARALSSRGMTPGFAKPFTAYESSLAARALVGLGVGAATLLLFTYVWPATGLTLILLLLLAAADVVLPAVSAGRKLVALQGALLMPVLAFAWLREAMERRFKRDEDALPEESGRLSLVRGLVRGQTLSLYLCATAISLLGALWVVGLLSSRMASVKIYGFSGIKLQQAGALVMIAAIYYLDISAWGGLAQARARVRRRVQELWNQPMLLGTMVVGLVALVALAFLLARSGNDPGVGVSPLELKFRAILDRLLVVRPRTKEFMIGHPALLLAIVLASRRHVRWALPLLIVGAIGQVSIVNTFCHLHTPLSVSVLRSVNGLWTGFFVALVVAFVADRVLSRRGRPVAE